MLQNTVLECICPLICQSHFRLVNIKLDYLCVHKTVICEHYYLTRTILCKKRKREEVSIYTKI